MAQERLELSYEQNKSDHLAALATAQEALTLFQSANDSVGIARAYSQIARCYQATSDFAEAIDNYNLALQLWRDLNDADQQAGTLIMLAYIEQRKGNWSNAISYYDQAETLSPNDPNRMGQIASGMADLFNENGLPEQAMAQYQLAINAYQQIPKQEDRERAVNRMIMNIGYTEFLQKQYSESMTSLQQALATFQPASLDAAECYEYLGRVHLARGESSVARQQLESSLPIYEAAGNVIEAERVRALIGQTYEQQGAFAPARSQYVQTLSVFRRLQDRISEALVSFTLGRLELKAGNLDQAEAYLKQSIENTEDLRTISIGRDVTTAYSASVHERYEAYITCLLRKSKKTSSPRLNEQAFEASELSRARSLVEMLHETQTNLLTGVDPQLVEKERNLRQLIRAKIDHRVELLAAKSYNNQELTDLETTLRQLQDEHKRLSEELQRLSPAYGQITQPTIYSLSQIQSDVLGDGQTALLEYVLGEDTSYAWVVTRNNIALTELPSEATITKGVQNVYDLLSTRPQPSNEEQLSKAIDDLGKLVLAPVANQLTAQRLIVVADGALNYIPFQLLRLPSDGEPLVASKEIVNTPSASILGQLRQERLRRPPPPKPLAAFGYPAFASNYAELKGTKTGDLLAQGNSDEQKRWGYAMRDIEVSGDALDTSTIQPLLSTRTELASLREVAGSDSFIASGFAASRETLVHTDLSQFAILHLATHGVLDPGRPELSGFILSTVDAAGHSQNGFITVQDVYQLQAPVNLVVLSACRTGLGKDIRGEGLIGLTRGFMYAGASSIAASLWRVDDDATAELMKEFYANMLQKGMTPAAALRQAQNSIRQQPGWRSPHYWAAFTLQGEYTEPIRVPIKSSKVLVVKAAIAVLVLLSLMAGCWWFWRRRARTVSPA